VTAVAGESVLVVEDTELLRRIYTDKLAQEGYKVFQAADGLECLNVVRTQPLDLILLDLVMPRMSGLEALEALKRDPRTKDLPVVILSNLGQDTDIQRGLDLGALDYLIKNSAKPADVSAKIRATLDNRNSAPAETTAFRLTILDYERDADEFVAAAKLPRRFFCPACEVQLVLEMVPRSEKPGWYEAHLLCSKCGREF
jgi:DNA-binding response OmpR family regulator